MNAPFSQSARAGTFALVVGAAAVAGHADRAAAQETPALLTSMIEAGAARAAIASAPPYAFMDPNGDPQGYLIDVSRAALEKLGVPNVTATVTTWDAMIPGLTARQYDFIPAGMNVTAARCEVVAFSAPVTAQQDALYTAIGNPKQLTSYSSVAERADARLGVLAGSSQEAFALASGVERAQLVTVPDIQSGIAAVVGGRADAFVAGQFSVQNPGERGVERNVDRESPLVGIGIVFRKEDEAVRDLFNAALDTLRADGTMEALYATQYGFTNWDVLAQLTQSSDLVASCD